jgi:hypothetical protein
MAIPSEAAPAIVGLAVAALALIYIWRLERTKPIKGWKDDEGA